MVLNGGTLDGRRYLSPKTIAYMGSNHIGPGSGVTPGPYYLPGPGSTFWADPKENMFVVFMSQTVSQRGRTPGGMVLSKSWLDHAQGAKPIAARL
jgi:CubicO group peptidase (beta-lactamase class C family)